MDAQPRDTMDAPWVLFWKEVDGAKTAKARLLARGYQDPDPRNCNVDIVGCVSRRWSHLQLISPGALQRSGRFGAWTKRMPLSRRAASTMRFFYVLHAGGIPRMSTGSGDCGQPRLVLVMPQLRLIGPCVRIFRIREIAFQSGPHICGAIV